MKSQRKNYSRKNKKTKKNSKRKSRSKKMRGGAPEWERVKTVDEVFNLLKAGGGGYYLFQIMNPHIITGVLKNYNNDIPLGMIKLVVVKDGKESTAYYNFKTLADAKALFKNQEIFNNTTLFDKDWIFM